MGVCGYSLPKSSVRRLGARFGLKYINPMLRLRLFSCHIGNFVRQKPKLSMMIERLTRAALGRVAAWAVALGCCTAAVAQQAAGGEGKFLRIENDRFWTAADSVPIYSQGGGIFRFADPATGQQRYYWYGVRYEQAEQYRLDPSLTPEGVTFRSVTCYSSDDLVNWRFEGDVLTRDELRENVGNRSTWVGRLGVAYVKELGRYAMFIQHAAMSSESAVLIALADSPTGRFKWHRWISMYGMIGTHNTGDQTVFTDEDTGKSYLIYSYGRGRNRIYVSEIGVKDGGVGLLDCHEVYRGAGREGNCMFKFRGKYYMCASDLYGWDSSHAYWLVADDIHGPYVPKDSMEVMDGCMTDYAHVTQTGFFVTVRGTKQETVVYCGDRWADFAGNGLGYNQWCPLSFNGDRPFFNSLSAWELNSKTGEWRVAPGNNYVLNGSFEADRRKIPSPVKPRQDFLRGWTTEFIAGTKVVNGNPDSLTLNYFNTRDDRRHVTGEKSLNITDTRDFDRRVSQQITAMPYVDLPDGTYSLSATVCWDGDFDRLVMFAESGGEREARNLTRAKRGRWERLSIKELKVSGGRAVVGFRAKGKAGAYCRIDDVELVRVK